MTSLIVLLAPLALVAGSPSLDAGVDGDASGSVAPYRRAAWRHIAEAFRAEPVAQVRIEQRLIIRVAPRGSARELLAVLPNEARTSRMRERKIGRCLPTAGIAGVEIGADDRLLLFMRDRRLISASLEKVCRARDFYSGFYVERSGDGLLCIGRDMLHSRTGTSCIVSRLRQLVPGGN